MKAKIYSEQNQSRIYSTNVAFPSAVFCATFEQENCQKANHSTENQLQSHEGNSAKNLEDLSTDNQAQSSHRLRCAWWWWQATYWELKRF